MTTTFAPRSEVDARPAHYDHPDWPAWLSAIRAAPDDDVTRLACADWLDEHGCGERAEFVRVQCSRSGKVSDLARILGGTGTEWVTAGIGRANDWAWSGGLMTCHDDPVEVSTSLGAVLTYARGFVHTVRAPLAMLYGGECQMGCQGSGRWAEWGTSRPCPYCRGTGTTVGILPDLLRREPVLRFEVVDVYPWTSELESASDDLSFSWWRDSEWVHRRGNERNAIGNLPDSLFVVMGDMFPGARLNWGFAANEHLAFPTREAATDALSAALLSWGLAKLSGRASTSDTGQSVG